MTGEGEEDIGGGASSAGARALWPTFSVLGPFLVTGRDAPITISAAKQRRVLSLLVLHANRAVSVDELVDGVWGGGAPRTADRTIHAYIAKLRRVLGPRTDCDAADGLIVTGNGRYRLAVDTAQVDALQFEALRDHAAGLLERGDAALAARALRQAASLWRGSAYDELDDHDAARIEARRLAELCATAAEMRIDAELRLGAAVELVPEIERLVAEQPLREQRWAQLMVALYRAGRQSEALRAFQRARAALLDELGVEPGRELRQLEAAILVHDPALIGSPPTPGPRHAAISDRSSLDDAELQALDGDVVDRPARTKKRSRLRVLAVVLLLVGGLALVARQRERGIPDLSAEARRIETAALVVADLEESVQRAVEGHGLREPNDAGAELLGALERSRRALCAIAGRDFTQDEWNELFPGRDYQHSCTA
jgi:DNA-binding SARP family transcriptional activator